MDKRNLAFDKINFILIAVGMLIVIIGFILMSGGESTDTHYDPSIFNFTRIKLAPMISLFGFLSIIYGIIRKPKDNEKIEN